jgi:hypothetical protein
MMQESLVVVVGPPKETKENGNKGKRFKDDDPGRIPFLNATNRSSKK